MSRIVKMFLVVVLAGGAQFGLADWRNWSHEGEEWGLFSEKSNWKEGQVPTSADIIGLPSTTGTAEEWKTYKMKIDSEATGNWFWSSPSYSQLINYTSNFVSIVEGGALTVNGFFFNHANPGAYKKIVSYCELVLDGGSLSVEGNGSQSNFYRMQVGVAGCEESLTRVQLKKGTLTINPSDNRWASSSPVELEISGGTLTTPYGFAGGPETVTESNIGVDFKLHQTAGEFRLGDLQAFTINSGDVTLDGGTFYAGSIGSKETALGDYAFRIRNPAVNFSMTYAITAHGTLTLELAKGVEIYAPWGLKLGYLGDGTVRVPRTGFAHWGRSVFIGGGTLNCTNSTSKDVATVRIGDAGLAMTNGTINARRLAMITCDSLGANGETPTNLFEIGGGKFELTDDNTYLYDLNHKTDKIGYEQTIIRQTGGSLRLNGINYTGTLGGTPSPLIETSGGFFRASGFTPLSLATNGITLRVIGGAQTNVFAGKFNYPDSNDHPSSRDLPNWIPTFLDGVIADTGLSAINTYAFNQKINVSAAVRPLGGFQMTTNATFCQWRKSANDALRNDDAYSTFPVGLFARTNSYGKCYSMPAFEGLSWFTTQKFQDVANWGFNPEAKIEGGAFAEAEGRAWGWSELKMKNPGSVRSVVVELTVKPVAPGVSVDSLAAGMCAAGYAAEVTDATAGRIAIKIPVERLGERDTVTRYFFDFTEFKSPEAIFNGVRTTNAVVTAYRCRFEKKGLTFLVR